MASFRRDPFSDLWAEFSRMQDEFHRVINGRTTTGLPLNVWQDEQHVFVETDLPDVDPDQLELFVAEGNQLTIQGERKAPEIPGAVWVRQERPFGRFTRSVALPVLVDADRVEAKYEHGVLKLTLPKSEAAKPRKITVKS